MLLYVIFQMVLREHVKPHRMLIAQENGHVKQWTCLREETKGGMMVEGSNGRVVAWCLYRCSSGKTAAKYLTHLQNTSTETDYITYILTEENYNKKKALDNSPITYDTKVGLGAIKQHIGKLNCTWKVLVIKDSH